MLDFGLLASLAIMLTVTTVFVRPWPSDVLSAGLLDSTLGAAGIGLMIGRLTALMLDDPASLLNLRDILIIRSGVEFWPGAVAATLWIAFTARREGGPVGARLAALAPGALIAWAFYEVTCLLRDGCPGPLSRFGLRPLGLQRPVFPIGIAVAVAAVGGALLVDRLHRRLLTPVQVVLVTGGLVAAIRSIASVWLPRIGTGITRQHRESIVVFVVAALSLVLIVLRHRAAGAAPTMPAHNDP